MRRLTIYGLGIITGVVAAVVIGVLLVWLWLPPSDSSQRAEKWAKNFVRDRERELGTNCEYVSQRADQFTQGPLAKIIETGRRGDDWVAEASVKYGAEVKWLRDKTFQCTLLSKPRETAKMPVDDNLNRKSELYQALDIFITPYGNKPASASSLKPEAFQKIERLYRDLTNGSSGRPQAGAAEPPR